MEPQMALKIKANVRKNETWNEVEKTCTKCVKIDAAGPVKNEFSIGVLYKKSLKLIVFTKSEKDAINIALVEYTPEVLRGQEIKLIQASEFHAYFWKALIFFS